MHQVVCQMPMNLQSHSWTKSAQLLTLSSLNDCTRACWPTFTQECDLLQTGHSWPHQSPDSPFLSVIKAVHWRIFCSRLWPNVCSIYSQPSSNRYLYVRVCVSMCTLWDVSEEDLSGTCNDVCSSAAELGHREVEREKKTQRERERKHWQLLNPQDGGAAKVSPAKPPVTSFITEFPVHTSSFTLINCCLSIHHRGFSFIVHN